MEWLPAACADVEDSVLVLASHQVRVHHSRASELRLRVRSNPIIEHCSDICVGPYAQLGYAGAAEDLEKANLGQEVDAQGLWGQVHDFGWLRSTPSPNWCGPCALSSLTDVLWTECLHSLFSCLVGTSTALLTGWTILKPAQ